MGIRVTYSYRKFRNSRLATFVDYITHNPLTATFLGFLLATPVLLLGCGLVALCQDTVVLKYVALVVALAGFLLFILGGLWVGLLADKLDLAGRISLRKLEKELQATKKEG